MTRAPVTISRIALPDPDPLDRPSPDPAQTGPTKAADCADGFAPLRRELGDLDFTAAPADEPTALVYTLDHEPFTALIDAAAPTPRATLRPVDGSGAAVWHLTLNGAVPAAEQVIALYLVRT